MHKKTPSGEPPSSETSQASSADARGVALNSNAAEYYREQERYFRTLWVKEQERTHELIRHIGQLNSYISYLQSKVSTEKDLSNESQKTVQQESLFSWFGR